MNRYLLFAIIFLISQPTFSQKKIKNDSICWSESKKLTWSDFKGKPRNVKAAYADMRASAFTFTNITASGFVKDDLPEFRILCRFVKSESWVADSTQANIQKHEQLHFDIAELYARKIRKGIADLQKKKEKKIDRYSDLINKQLDELRVKNQEFDSKTIHGTNTEKESAWEKDIAKEMDSLKEFKSTAEMCGRH